MSAPQWLQDEQARMFDAFERLACQYGRSLSADAIVGMIEQWKGSADRLDQAIQMTAPHCHWMPSISQLADAVEHLPRSKEAEAVISSLRKSLGPGTVPTQQQVEEAARELGLEDGRVKWTDVIGWI